MTSKTLPAHNYPFAELPQNADGCGTSCTFLTHGFVGGVTLPLSAVEFLHWKSIFPLS
jgi:hypothetical protein